MGVAGLLAGDGAQAKALAGVEAGRLQPAVIEAEALRLAVFQEKLAVIGAMQGIADQPVEAGAIQSGPGEKQVLGNGSGGTGSIQGCRLRNKALAYLADGKSVVAGK